MKKLIGFSILLLITNVSYGGGGWVYKKGKGFVKVGQNMILSRYYFQSNGNLNDLASRISLYTTSLYVEYGITDRLNAVAYVPFFVRAIQNNIQLQPSGTVIPGDAINSFGDTDVGLKYGFFQNKSVVMSISLIAGLPFGYSEVSSDNVLRTGDGEFNQLVKLEVSKSFYPAPFYASAVLGFNNRTNGFSEEFHYGAEVGYKLGQCTGVLRVYSVNSLFNGTNDEFQGNTAFANNIEYFSYGPEIIYTVNNKLGVSASAGFAFSGRNVLGAPNFGFGLFMKL